MLYMLYMLYMLCLGSILVAAHIILVGWDNYCDFHTWTVDYLDQGMLNSFWLVRIIIVTCITIKFVYWMADDKTIIYLDYLCHIQPAVALLSDLLRSIQILLNERCMSSQLSCHSHLAMFEMQSIYRALASCGWGSQLYGLPLISAFTEEVQYILPLYNAVCN